MPVTVPVLEYDVHAFQIGNDMAIVSVQGSDGSWEYFNALCHVKWAGEIGNVPAVVSVCNTNKFDKDNTFTVDVREVSSEGMGEPAFEGQLRISWKGLFVED